jgi:myo-inositol-1-phosphate synthase
MNYIPAGLEDVARFYAYCALDAEVSFVNNSSVCIVGKPLWALRFEYKNISIIGDDTKSLYIQFLASILQI